MEADDDNKKKLRTTLVGALGKYCFKDAAVVAEAMSRFEAFVADPTDAAALSADIRAAVFSIAIQSDNSEAVYEKLISAHAKVTDGAVKIHIYQALGDVPSVALKQKALEYALSGAVRSQDLIYIPMMMVNSGKAGADC